MSSASPSTFATNGITRSQNSASSYPPSSNTSAAPSEHNGSDAQRSAPPSRNGGYVQEGSSSESVNGYADAGHLSPHDEQIIDHLYNQGFQMGEYADTIVYAHAHRYKLHALILSRSPYMTHLLSSSPKVEGVSHLLVPLESFPEITDEGFALALGYLYSAQSLNSLSVMNARAVLLAGCLLGGMDDLCNYAYQACRDSITVDTFNEWVDFVDSLSPSDGLTTPSEVQQRPHILGPYADLLRSDVFNFLVVQLPSILDAQSPTGSGRDTLLGIFSRLGFDLFKSAVESPMFEIGSDQERFRFAKAAIELRKRTRGAGVDETVVLAFGGGHEGSNVEVKRKTKKKALYKVG